MPSQPLVPHTRTASALRRTAGRARAVPAFALMVALGSGCHLQVRRESDAWRADVRREIGAMMSASAAAWTRGNLDAFMADYVADATYVTPQAVVHGRDAIRRRYAPRFAPGARHDSLSFEDVEVDPLARDLAHVIAYYKLTRGDSLIARGPTSLLMRRSPGEPPRWRIVHDHSS